MTRTRTHGSALLLIGSLLAVGLGGASIAVAHEPLVIFLVRHAEKSDASSDPELSAAGRMRAAGLAGLLRDSSIQHVHSSDFIRTRDTAAPVASALGVEVDLYDPRNLPALVEQLRQAGGRHLVVGHSNTTPEVVELLGGEPGTEIDEPGEYDRLYVVTIGLHGEANTVLMRYGEPFAGPGD